MLGHGEQLLLCELGKLSNHEPEKPAAWAHVLGWRTLGLLRLFKACSGSSSISRPTPHALTVAASHAQSVPLCLCRHDARLCSAGRTASRFNSAAPQGADGHRGTSPHAAIPAPATSVPVASMPTFHRSGAPAAVPRAVPAA